MEYPICDICPEFETVFEEYAEYPICDVCGAPIDYCLGHGIIG